MKSVFRCLLAACAVLAAGSAGAALEAPVSASHELAERFQAQAPLALSADGRWRVHVDARRVLHRVRVDGTALPASLGLALRIRAVAIAGDGRRAVVLSDAGCVGRVDFDALARVRWLADERLSTPELAWLASPPARCLVSAQEVNAADQNPDAGLGLRAVALSADGRLLAIRAGVADLTSSRVVARLPESMAIAGNPLLMRLQFIDGDRQLLALAEPLFVPQGDVGYASRGDLAMAWDVPSGRLRRLAPLASFDGAAQDASPGAGTAPPGPAMAQPTCGAAMALPRAGLPVVGDGVVDPRGRWVANVSWESPNASVRSDVGLLVIQRTVDRLEIARFALRRDVRGLVASGDGAAIYGLTDVDGGSVAAVTDGQARLLGDGVIEMSVPVSGLVATAEPMARLPAHDCGGSDEAIDARDVPDAARPLPMRWRRTIVDTFHARLQNFPDIAAWPCTDVVGVNSVFIRRDASVWLDEFADSARIDLATGRTQQRLPIVREADVCAVPVPAADAFLTWQGDTITLRRFDPRDGGRRLVQARAGWRVGEVEVRSGYVMVAWEAKAEALKQFPPATEGGHGLPVHVVAYADTTGRQLGDVFQEDPIGETESWSPPRDPLPSKGAPGDAASCRAPDAPPPGLWRVRIDALDSVRGDTCSHAAGLPRTGFRTGLDLDKSVPGASRVDDYRREVRDVDGAIAVVQFDARLRVFDLAQRRELGRIELPPGLALRNVTLLASRGVVLVEADQDAPDGKTSERTLTAYTFAVPAPAR